MKYMYMKSDRDDLHDFTHATGIRAGRMLVLLATLFALMFTASWILSRDGLLTSLLYAAHVLPEPEPYTELFVNDHRALVASLPQRIEAGDQLNFSFTIRNREGHAMEYPYSVAIEDATSSTVIDSGTTTVAADQAVFIQERYVFPSARSDAVVRVELTNIEQSVHFFIPPRNLATP